MPRRAPNRYDSSTQSPPGLADRNTKIPSTVRLTQRVVNDAAATGVKHRIADHEVKGLFLRITPAGAKSYVLRYSQDGRRGEAAIGDARAITLAAARAKAIDMLNALTVQRVDPVHAKQAAILAEKKRKHETFAALTLAYQEDAARRKRPKTLEFEAWLLTRHVLPNLGNRRFADIRRADIITLIERTGDVSGPITANRLHAVIRQVLNYALKRDLIEANPALGIDRMFQERSRERVLTEEEIRTLWAFLEAARANKGLGLAPGQKAGERAINGVSPAVATALQLCLITLQRAGEVVGARAEEFNWREKLWIIPAERMKGNRAHAVPLSNLAAERFQDAFVRSGGAIAFPERGGAAPLDGKRLTRAMARACKLTGIAHAGPHDLRRTGRTMMTSERVGVGYEVAERVIAHLVGSAVSRVYDRNEYLREKRVALEAWAKTIEAIIA